MMERHTLTRWLPLASTLMALAGCSASHICDGDSCDPVPGPDGAVGVCCPVTDFTGCSPPGIQPGGGWAPSADACSYTIAGFDGYPFRRVLDAYGCARVEEDTSAPLCGMIMPPPPPPPDAGGPDAGSSPCAGLGAVACMGNPTCAPGWDDTCCPICSPGPCADCTNPDYLGCFDFDASCMGASCHQTPLWVCRPVAPDCSTAFVVDPDSCTVAGCVPVVAAAGTPDPGVACVPLTADSCTTACRRIAPDCPDGTVPEGDGFCYTDRCIPAFACE